MSKFKTGTVENLCDAGGIYSMLTPLCLGILYMTVSYFFLIVFIAKKVAWPRIFTARSSVIGHVPCSLITVDCD